MTGEPEEGAGREEAAGTTDTWQEVGKQFQRLGESLSSAFRTARENEDNRRTLRNLSEGLGSLASEVGKAIDEVASSDEGQWVRQEAEKAAKSAREVGADMCQDVRPHVVSALNQVGTELQTLMGKLEAKTGPDKSSES